MSLARDLIKKHEGLRLKPYLCPAKKRTVGYGWNLDAHKPPEDIAACLRLTGAITEDMAERLLFISISAAMKDCQFLYPEFDGFTERRQAALIDFVFNVGAGTALRFKKMRKAVNGGDWNRAADEMVNSEWYRQVGRRGPEIVGMVRDEQRSEA
jgi:lysozyme